MRVVIVDSDLAEGRRSAAQIEDLLPDADVLLYDASDSGLAAIAEHSPDVVLVGSAVGAVEGPQFVASACQVAAKPKYVGMVPAPDAEWSSRYISASASLVVGRPMSRLEARNALRHAGNGIP